MEWKALVHFIIWMTSRSTWIEEGLRPFLVVSVLKCWSSKHEVESIPFIVGMKNTCTKCILLIKDPLPSVFTKVDIKYHSRNKMDQPFPLMRFLRTVSDQNLAVQWEGLGMWLCAKFCQSLQHGNKPILQQHLTQATIYVYEYKQSMNHIEADISISLSPDRHT